MNKIYQCLIMKKKERHKVQMIFLNHKIFKEEIKIQNQIPIIREMKIIVLKILILHFNPIKRILFRILK